MAQKPFFTAEWRNLAIVNYEVPRQVLAPYVPRGLLLDSLDNRYYISIMGLEFNNLKVKGIPVPFHKKFTELNLVTYVRGVPSSMMESLVGGRRGILPLKEIVPGYLASMAARTMYGEPFITRPMCHAAQANGFAYSVYDKGRWNDLIVYNNERKERWANMYPGGKASFFLDRNHGFCKKTNGGTNYYEIARPPWKVKKCQGEIIGLESLFGTDFEPFLKEAPHSAYMVDGSPINVFSRKKLA